ncbi:MAG: MGMT family protein, partial [Ruminococcus sp.]|nr:MGMT family protein [Ruminococcus sp.]
GRGNLMAEKSFYDRIYEAVLQIPYGKVATYGQIATMAGNGRAARAVGNALHINPAPDVIPCYRVVNSKGRLAPHFAFGGSDVQKELLEAEGIEVIDDMVDLKKYQYRG